MTAIRDELSPGLNIALEPILAQFAVTPRSGRHQPPARKANFDHRHIPQRVPDAWFDPFFGRLPTAGAGPVRRAAAIALVRLVDGGTQLQARHLLGIPATLTSGTFATTAWLHNNAEAFNSSLNNLADYLDAMTDLVDYGNRRQQLANWSIPAEQWAQTVREQSEPSHGNHRAPDWNDLRRRFVSWMVWTAVTSSERIFAPASVLPVPTEENERHNRRRIIQYWWDLERATDPNRTRVIKIIDRHAEQTIMDVDGRCQLSPKGAN
jgi:hypothetical protein